MKYLIFALLALLLFQCKEKELPIIEKPDPVPVVLDKPCYDSTYFDTTLVMKKVQFPYFSIELPEGAEYDWGWLNDHTWGGYISFGCDSFRFEYGAYAPSRLWESHYHSIDTLNLNGYAALLGFGHTDLKEYPNFETYDSFYYDFIVKEDDEKSFSMGIMDPEYHYYALKMFHSFKFGW